MTKDSYFELCEVLGTEPVDEEIPVEIEDFPPEVQLSISIYFKLRDEWESMSGTYMGKSYLGLQDILDILEVEKADRKDVLEWIAVLDHARSQIFKAQKSQDK
jgi:hypothetical protein